MKIKLFTNPEENKITRKEALKKSGKLAALTAATMMMIMKPSQAHAEGSGQPTVNEDRWTRPGN